MANKLTCKDVTSQWTYVVILFIIHTLVLLASLVVFYSYFAFLYFILFLLSLLWVDQVASPFLQINSKFYASFYSCVGCFNYVSLHIFLFYYFKTRGFLLLFPLMYRSCLLSSPHLSPIPGYYEII